MNQLDRLFDDLAERQNNKKLPPVNQWHPDRTGSIDIRIDTEGAWWHEGRVIKRQGLVNVFSTVLRCDDGVYFLVTPAEKLQIVVEDVPFIGVDFEVTGTGSDQQVIVTTNVEDHIVLDSEHSLFMTQEKPYFQVRDNLIGRINRSTFYRLVEHGVEEEGAWHIYSRGARFNLGAV
ncbi:MAG: hypothetical protein ACI9UU_003809 [Candidatus Azotimanducaceae bacterium]|jgi:hypothetical protein